MYVTPTTPLTLAVANQPSWWRVFFTVNCWTDKIVKKIVWENDKSNILRICAFLTNNSFGRRIRIVGASSYNICFGGLCLCYSMVFEIFKKKYDNVKRSHLIVIVSAELPAVLLFVNNLLWCVLQSNIQVLLFTKYYHLDSNPTCI